MSSENTEVEMAEKERCGRGSRGGRCGGRSRLWFIPLFLIAAVLKGALVMVLWNALIPQIFHGPELKILQAIGLLILAKLLVGSKGPHGFGGRFGRHHAMRKRFWARMSDEERNELRDHLRKRWKE